MIDACYCDYDYDPPSVYRCSIVKARKPHKCDECGGSIKPSERYEYVFAIWDNNPDSVKTCERCVDIQTWVRNNVPCFCPMHCNMDQQMREAVEDATRRAPDETRGLWFGLLRRFALRKRHNSRAELSA